MMFLYAKFIFVYVLFFCTVWFLSFVIFGNFKIKKPMNFFLSSAISLILLSLVMIWPRTVVVIYEIRWLLFMTIAVLIVIKLYKPVRK